MKLILGGTFDPIHLGHIQLSLHIYQQFNHPVSLLPLAGSPNYKAPPIANLKQRLAMLELVIKRHPNALNIDFSETKSALYSPTIVTLRHLRKIYGYQCPIYFIIGADSLINLDTWDSYQELFDLTNFIVIRRPNYPLTLLKPELQQLIQPRLSAEIKLKQNAGQIILSTFKPLAISSTEIRKRCLNNQDITKLVSPEIALYIQQQQLYKGK